MSRMIFLNLPVTDLDKSVEFFTALGFEFNPQFTDENATAMVVNDQAIVMLLVRDFFSTFTDKSIADTSSIEALTAVSAESREDVDDVIAKAVAAGGRKTRDIKDEGFMYGGAFEDLDGHVWEVLWMDPTAMPG